jgi:hypothetical protein
MHDILSIPCLGVRKLPEQLQAILMGTSFQATDGSPQKQRRFRTSVPAWMIQKPCKLWKK